jgi:tetratricopeptide (TPR) repeat protein
MDAIFSSAYNRMVEQGDIWYRAGDYPRLAQMLRFQSSLFPSDYESNTSLGWMLESMDQHAEALATYIAYKRNNPNMPDAVLPEAQFYFIRRIYAKLPPLLEPALKRKPHPNAYRMLARAYEQLDLFQDSKRVLESYIEIAPGDEQAKRNLQRVERKIRGETAAKAS